MQFQKESTITTKVQDQNTIDETHSCLVKIVLQATEKNIPKTPPETKKRPTVAWWNKKCEREERIVRTECRKHHREPTNTTKLSSLQRGEPSNREFSGKVERIHGASSQID